MASLIFRYNILVAFLFSTLILILGWAFPTFAVLEEMFGKPHWRPSSIPAIIMTNSCVDTQAITTTLTHTEGDEDKLLVLALRAPKDEATSALCRYIERYEQNNRLTGQAWGRAVYGLGLVQTEHARRYLLKLWERHDERLQRQHNLLKIEDMIRSVSPLRAIGDALHFYLSEASMRKWFVDRIAEAEAMPLVTDSRAPAFCRKLDRFQLLIYLYRWDMIDSVDNQLIVSDERILAHYPFSSAYVENIELSADRLVSFMKTLPLLRLDITEGEWKELRSSPREYELDSIACLLGLPLAKTVWKKYLSGKDFSFEKGVQCRLWLTTLWTYLASLNRTNKVGKWLPSVDERALLRDALTYTKNLPPGHLRKLATEALWGIACFAEEQGAPPEVYEIRGFAMTLLDSSLRNRTLHLIHNASKGGGVDF